MVKNDKETFDYTNPNPGAGAPGKFVLFNIGRIISYYKLFTL